MANSSKAPFYDRSCPLGFKFTIDFVNFAGAKGKMFVMQKYANLNHELTYLLRSHSWLLSAQKKLPIYKPREGLPLEFFVTIW